MTGYVTAEEKLETAAVLLEAGAPEALAVRAMTVLAGAVPVPQRDSALWASGWAAADERLRAEKNRDDAWITAAYVTALLNCDDRHRKTGVHTAVLNWNEAAADPVSVWHLVAALREDAVRYALTEAEKAADRLEKALCRELPGGWTVTFAETCLSTEEAAAIFRSYDMEAFEKAPRVWWVKTRNVDEERGLTAIAVHWAGGVTVKRMAGWPAELTSRRVLPVTPTRWVKRRRLMESAEADPCRPWFDGTSSEVTFELEDPLYEEALEAMQASGRTSTAFLQRTFGIGYRRAAMLMERLEKAGVVSGTDDDGRHRGL